MVIGVNEWQAGISVIGDTIKDVRDVDKSRFDRGYKNNCSDYAPNRRRNYARKIREQIRHLSCINNMAKIG